MEDDSDFMLDDDNQSDHFNYDDDDLIMSSEDDHEYAQDDEDNHAVYNDVDIGFQPIQVHQKEKKLYQTDFEVHSTPSVLETQRKDAQHVSDVCGILSQHAATLLRSFKWNKERLLESYMEDPERILQKAGVVNGSLGCELRSAPRGYMCSICCNEEEGQQMKLVKLACQHEYCTDCYRTFLTQKIKEDGEARRLMCPMPKCNTVVDADTIRQLVDAPVLEKYQNLLLRAFVDDSEFLRWCPAPNCENIVECHVRQGQLSHVVPSVQCKCQHRFCFGCGLNDHQPCICALAKKWLQKCADDSETANWIHANTKECIKCRSTIEKNGGCNHMTCKTCKTEFCWVCMGPWSEHGNSWYNCNRFDEKSSVEARDAQSKSRTQLERYLHYFNRYANHEQSAKLANDFYSRTEKKMDEMQQTSELSWIEVQFMKKALEIVLECRQTLKWTYAFAFYLEKNNQTVLFEDNQRDMEMAVENLNELIEKPIPGQDDPEQREKLMELKQMVLDKTEYCSRRRDVLLEDTCKGLLEDRWKYNVEL